MPVSEAAPSTGAGGAGAGAGPNQAAPSVRILTFYACILMLIPSQYAIGSLGAAGTPAGVLAVVFFLWYCFAWLSPRSTVVRERQPLRLAMGLLLFSVLASYAAAMTRPLNVLELNAADRGLIIVAGWVGLALLTADSIDSVTGLEILLRRVVILATILAIIGVTQFFTGFNVASYIHLPGLVEQSHIIPVVPRDSFNRPAGTAIHPLEFGVVLGMILPLALHGARHAPAGRRGVRWTQVLLIATAMMMTVSRSGMMAMALVMVIVLPTWDPGARRRAYAAAVAFMGLVYIAIPGLLGTIKALVFHIGADSSTTDRTNGYTAAARYFTLHPWFGRGFGTFLPQFYTIFDNQYVLTIVEMGIIGLVALVTLFCVGWWLAREARKTSTDPRTRHLAQCLAASVATAAFGFGVFDAGSFPMTCGMTFLILGCCGALWRLVRVPEDAPEPVLEPTRSAS
jgi:polysaccharide biosynthesis protein PslJ